MWARSISVLGLAPGACALPPPHPVRSAGGTGARLSVCSSATLVRAGVVAERVELLLEALEVAEVAVDRREPDVRDLIERAQPRQHALADIARRDLGHPELGDLALDLERQRADLVARHRALGDRGDCRPCSILARSNGSRRPSFLITSGIDSSIRS